MQYQAVEKNDDALRLAMIRLANEESRLEAIEVACEFADTYRSKAKRNNRFRLRNNCSFWT